MPNVLIRSISEEELSQLRAMAEARSQSLQAFMTDMVRKTLSADHNRKKLAEIEARLKSMPSATYTTEDLMAAKDAPRHGVAT
ncbi:hypothetical protein [Glycomyces arizonensis]|uniref:hypothetical protein n=1 Tax=Glycomyces arizonensis TaxID=256035 RepID=UPI000409FC51|nr:hypothetical protein [Glycomyces arizonensis]